MPTGYTSGVADGKVTTLEQFAWVCARAFGPLIHMRDEATDAPITEPEPCRFYADQLAAARERQAFAINASEIDLRERYSEEVMKERQAALRREDERRRVEDRYRSMEREVRAWSPPTDLEPLRAMMLKQLEESRSFDCCEPIRPAERSLSTFRGEMLTAAARDIGYYTEEIRKEAERIEWARRWIRLLRDSLAKPGPEVKP